MFTTYAIHVKGPPLSSVRFAHLQIFPCRKKIRKGRIESIDSFCDATSVLKWARRLKIAYCNHSECFAEAAAKQIRRANFCFFLCQVCSHTLHIFNYPKFIVLTFSLLQYWHRMFEFLCSETSETIREK